MGAMDIFCDLRLLDITNEMAGMGGANPALGIPVLFLVTLGSKSAG